jgi:hypothetical protein
MLAMDAHKNDWVTIHHIVLEPAQRPSHLPADTQKVPLEMWVKGFLKADANIGQTVEVKTMTGRVVKGQLIEINPYYKHDYGKCVPELLKIGLQAREIIRQEGEGHE